MDDARVNPRAAYHLAVDLYCGTETTPRRCQASDISSSGLFAATGHVMKPGQSVSVAIGDGGRTALHLNGVVRRVAPGGVGIAFTDNSPASLEVLEAMLTPRWGGTDLLAGVIELGRWDRTNNLAGWLRLTSLVAEMQNRARLQSILS